MFKVLSMFAVLSGLALVSTGTARADPPDFSICEGLTGVALGLCRAGVVIGCADEPPTGNETACSEIANNYEMMTGGPPPWLAPPLPLCPCDYAVIPKDVEAGGWITGAEFVNILYTCPPVGEVVRAVFAGSDGVGGLTAPILTVDTMDPFFGSLCTVQDQDGFGNFPAVTFNQAQQCRLDIIDYATEFLELNPEVPVNIQCLE